MGIAAGGFCGACVPCAVYLPTEQLVPGVIVLCHGQGIKTFKLRPVHRCSLVDLLQSTASCLSISTEDGVKP